MIKLSNYSRAFCIFFISNLFLLRLKKDCFWLAITLLLRPKNNAFEVQLHCFLKVERLLMIYEDIALGSQVGKRRWRKEQWST